MPRTITKEEALQRTQEFMKYHGMEHDKSGRQAASQLFENFFAGATWGFTSLVWADDVDVDVSNRYDKWNVVISSSGTGRSLAGAMALADSLAKANAWAAKLTAFLEGLPRIEEAVEEKAKATVDDLLI